MTYRTIHTAHGLAALAQAEATGTPVLLASMAVGDGNGNPTAPDESQTALVRERYRAAVNRVYRDAANPRQFIAEFVIPASVGGFTVRECGLFDAEGELFTVANTPAMYKPETSEGAYADTVVRMVFKADNADAVAIVVDPNVAVATHTWVINNVTASTVIPGGTLGQVLRKASNTDGDTEWADPDTANVIVDVIEEVQTLAAAQVVVDLLLCTTQGLALYVNGTRLRPDQWTAHPTIDTRLTLAASYADGTKLICAQNEPNASVPRALARDLNLADVPDPATARTNLGVPSLAQLIAQCPPGFIAMDASPFLPPGFLLCNGAVVNVSTYPRLFERIGMTYYRPGSGADGFNTFQLPDLRGMFPRGLDEARGVDPGRELGTQQDDEFKSHTHGVRADNGGFNTNTNNIVSGTDRGQAYLAQSTAAGGSETRPKNIALRFVIKT